VKRLAWLLPLAFVLMWGGVLLQTERPTSAARTPPAEVEAQEEAEAPAPAVAAAAPAEREPEPPPEQPPAAPPVRAVEMRAAAMRALAAQSARTADGRPIGRAERVDGMVAQTVVQSAAAAMKGVHAKATEDELLGEHGEGVTSPQFVQLETDYTSEPRDGVWATAEETRLAQLIQQHPISKELALLNCQDSVCRIMLETKSKDAFERLLSVPGLAEATGLSSSSPYSLRSGQLSVYYRRTDTATASSKTER
jgi:hypothetical protein